MAITSNLLLATEVSRPAGDGFSIIVKELEAIKSLLADIGGARASIDISISGNAAQQLKGIQQSVSKAAGGAGKGINIPITASAGDLAKVQTSVSGIVKGPLTDLEKLASKTRANIAGLDAELKKATVTSRELRSNQEIITNVTARAGKGVNKKTEEFVTTQKIVNLEQQRAIAEQKRADATARKQATLNESNKRDILGLSKEGFTPSLKEGNSELLKFRKNVGGVVDEIASVNLATNKTTFSLRDNAERVKDTNTALQKQVGLLEAASQRQSVLGRGFKEFRTSVTETTKGRESTTEFRKITTGPLELFTGKPEVQIAKVNNETGKLTETTLRGAQAAKLIGDNYLASIGKVVQWTVATSAVFATIRLIKEAITETANLEEGTILLARVGKGFENSLKGTQGEIGEQVKIAQKLTAELVNLGTTFGVSATEAQQAAAIFARSGLNQKETLEATKVAIIASKVAELGLVDAARLLSSELAQFKLKAEDLLPSLDRLNALSNSYRVTTNDLLQSISRTGSVFAEQGRAVDELTSLTAVLSQTTARTGSEIGTALKTIASNLERVDVANKLVEATGVAFQDAEGSTGNFSKTLSILQVQLDKLSKSERNNLVIQTAGVRQRNILEAALRGSTEALLAQIRSIEDTGSASNELKLQATTLATALDRLQASFTNLVSGANAASALKALVDTVTALINFFSLFNGVLIRSGVALTVFLGIRKAAAFLLPILQSLTISLLQLSFGNTAIITSSLAASRAFFGQTVAANALKFAMSGLSITSALLTVGTFALTSFFISQAQAAREAEIEIDRKNEVERQAVKNAVDLANAERDLADQFSFQVKRLREIEAQLVSLRAVREREAAATGRPIAPPTTKETILEGNRQQIIENSNRISKGRGLEQKSVEDLTDAEKVLAELRDKSLLKDKEAESKSKESLETNTEIANSLQVRIDKLNEIKKVITDLGDIGEFPAGLPIRSKTRSAATEITEIQEGLKSNEIIKFRGRKPEDILDDIKKSTNQLQESLGKARAEIDKAGESIDKFGKKGKNQTAIIELNARVTKSFQRLTLEIEAVNEATSRINSVSDALNLDKSIAKQIELNHLREIDLELTKEANSLVEAGEQDSPRVKQIADQIEKLRKTEIDLNVEKFRSQIDIVSKFLKQRFKDAFDIGGNITKRSVQASRRFLELGEELDALHELGAETARVEASFQELFSNAQSSAAGLKTELKSLAKLQNAAAIATLQTELKREGLETSTTGADEQEQRLKLEQRIQESALDAIKKQEIIRKAARSAAQVQPDEATIAGFAKTQAEREAAGQRLNELADLQLRTAEELISREKEITAELRQQTKEQIKQLGLLGEEDKLRVLAQAAFFAKNPNAQISASQQFLAPAETNRIGQEFFGRHLAKGFDNEKEPLGQLFFDAGFGNERTRQLQDSQKALQEKREQFAGAGATDAKILEIATKAADKLRQQAIQIQESSLKAFFDRLGAMPLLGDVNLAGLKVNKKGGLDFDVIFKPSVDIKPLVDGIEAVINSGFIRLRNQILEFSREGFFLDPKKFGAEQGLIPEPPNFGAGGVPFQLREVPKPQGVPGGPRTPAVPPKGVPLPELRQQDQRVPLPPAVRKDTLEAMMDAPSVMEAIKIFFGGKPEGKQKGGFVPGSGRGDIMPIMAEPGEFVWSRDDVRQHGDVIRGLHNSGGGRKGGRKLRGNIFGFQDGGDPSQAGSKLGPEFKPPTGVDRNLFFRVLDKEGQPYTAHAKFGGLGSVHTMFTHHDPTNSDKSYFGLDDITHRPPARRLIQKYPEYKGYRIVEPGIRLAGMDIGKKLGQELTLRGMVAFDAMHNGKSVYWTSNTNTYAAKMLKEMSDSGVLDVRAVEVDYGVTSYVRSVTAAGIKKALESRLADSSGAATGSIGAALTPEAVKAGSLVDSLMAKRIGAGDALRGSSKSGILRASGRLLNLGAQAYGSYEGADAMYRLATDKEKFFSGINDENIQALYEQIQQRKKHPQLYIDPILGDRGLNDSKISEMEERLQSLLNSKAIQQSRKYDETLKFLDKQKSLQKFRKENPAYENPPSIQARRYGGVIGGVGSGDKQHVMAEAGEFFVNKDDTKKNLPLLQTINSGGFPDLISKLSHGLPDVGRFQKGGLVGKPRFEAKDLPSQEELRRREIFAALDPETQKAVILRHMQDQARGGRLEPRMIFPPEDLVTPEDLAGISAGRGWDLLLRNKSIGAGGKGGRFEKTPDFALDAALAGGVSQNQFGDNSGAGRGRVASGDPFGVRGTGSRRSPIDIGSATSGDPFGVRGTGTRRAPSAATVSLSARALEQQRLQAELQNRLANPPSHEGEILVGSPGFERLVSPGPIKTVKEQIEKMNEGKIRIGPQGFDKTVDPGPIEAVRKRIEKLNEGKVPIGNPIEKLVDPGPIEEVKKAIAASKTAFNIIRDSGTDNSVKPGSPVDRVREAIKEQMELDRARRKAEFQENISRRKAAFGNRGESFVQNELAKRGIGLGGNLGGGGGANAGPQGNIPGVPADIGKPPLFQPNQPIKMPDGQQQPQKFPAQPSPLFPHDAPGQLGQNRNHPQLAPKIGVGSVMHPQVDWGPAMISFELLIGQSLVNAFTRVAPILAQQIEQNLRNIPAKPANFRPVG